MNERTEREYGESIANKNLCAISLLAPPQWGKTGVIVYLAFLYHLSPYRPVQPSDLCVLTGLSSNIWIEQTKERMIFSRDFVQAKHQNVFHQNQLTHSGDFVKAFSANGEAAVSNEVVKPKGNRVFLIDEAHVGNTTDSRMATAFRRIQLNSAENVLNNGSVIVYISATPGMYYNFQNFCSTPYSVSCLYVIYINLFIIMYIYIYI
jgi:hypothetical protein